MSRAGVRWEMRRLSEFGTALVCFAAGVVFCLTREGAGEPPVDWFLPAFLLAGALGACVAADANIFAGREEGVADLMFLVTRPVGRMPLFRLRLGVVACWGLVVWGSAAAYCLAWPAPDPWRGAWLADWVMSLSAYLALALAMLGLATEPREALGKRLLARRTLAKLGPLYVVALVLWIPVLAGEVDIARTGPAQYYLARAPLLTWVVLVAMAAVHIRAIASDWARTDIVS